MTIASGFEQTVTYDYQLEDGAFHAHSATIQSIGMVDNKELKVYPNPATNQVTIEGLALQNARIVLYDVAGRAVLVASGNASNGQTLDLSGLEAGSYLIQISGKQLLHTKRLLIH